MHLVAQLMRLVMLCSPLVSLLHSVVTVLLLMNSMKLVIPLHFISRKKTPNDAVTATPESIHTKDESKRGIAFAFIFGVN